MVDETKDLKVRAGGDGSKAEVRPVTPDAMLVIYLDEIAGRLSDMQEMLEAERSEGEVTKKDISVTGALPIEYDIRRDEGVEFLTADIYNDGPNTVYILVDNRMGKEIIIEFNHGIRIDRIKAKKKLHWLYFRCNSGENAEVHVIGQW